MHHHHPCTHASLTDVLCWVCQVCVCLAGPLLQQPLKLTACPGQAVVDVVGEAVHGAHGGLLFWGGGACRGGEGTHTRGSVCGGEWTEGGCGQSDSLLLLLAASYTTTAAQHLLLHPPSCPLLRVLPPSQLCHLITTHAQHMQPPDAPQQTPTTKPQPPTPTQLTDFSGGSLDAP